VRDALFGNSQRRVIKELSSSTNPKREISESEIETREGKMMNKKVIERQKETSSTIGTRTRTIE
jgi:hypothetical protein